MDFGGFCLSKNKTEILLDQQIDQNNSPELLNQLLNHLSIEMTQRLPNKRRIPIPTPAPEHPLGGHKCLPMFGHVWLGFICSNQGMCEA